MAAAQAGLCEVVTHQNVIVDAVLDICQDARCRNRIAVFHYSGQAKSYALLLETVEGRALRRTPAGWLPS